jgi:NAD(P)-dependent dehydrogenase (short-subunit alcohol dehydrogenase family)
MADWTENDVPDQSGRIALITGANSGIGWDAARVLAARGAVVLLGARSRERGGEAMARIRAIHPAAAVRLLEVDLSDLESVARAAEQVRSEHTRLDLLINNAGLMMIPARKTAQGFEMQLGVNHLGHFALTGQLLPQLQATPGSRVVSVSSNGHKFGRIRFEDLHWESGYSPAGAYAQSKLANLLFTFELQRRLEAAGCDTTALAAHPGGSNTNLGRENPGGLGYTLLGVLRPLFERFVAQSSAMGALTTLRAAVDPGARGGEYYGPGGRMEQTGYPVRVDSNERSKNAEDARRLWELSEQATGGKYAL